MKKTNLLGTTLFSLALLASCNSVEETPGAFSTLQVKVTNTTPESRAIVTGTTLPAGSEIGVTLLDAAGQNYDDVPYANLKYTSANGTDWAVSGATAPLLSATDGKAIAYYPWKDAADYTALAVETASQTDYMYSGWVEGINNSAPEASFTMNHGLSAFRVILKKEDAYKAAATATTVSVKSDAFVASATMSAVDGSLSAWTGNGDVTVDMDDITLSTSDQYTDIMVVPAQAAGTKATFTVAVEDAGSNSKNYTVDVPFTTAMLQGKCYQFTLTLTATGFEASTVAVTEWGQVTNAGSGSLSPVKPPVNGMIDLTTAANGVYAVAQNGLGVNVANADESCIAVALIVSEQDFEQRMWIEKNGENNITSIKTAYTADGATNTDYTYFYWGGEIDYMDSYWFGSYLNNTSNVWPFLDLNEISVTNDFSTWEFGTCLNDFYGKKNTEMLLKMPDSDSYKKYANMGTWCNKFNETETENYGYSDWCIPALGQLALIYLNLDKINEALAVIKGKPLEKTEYWSSSIISRVSGERLNFNDGIPSSGMKHYNNKVRFIREIVNIVTKNEIYFGIDNKTYQTGKNMTWQQWIASSYNVDGLTILENVVWDKNQSRYLTLYNGEGWSTIESNDIIRTNRIYGWQSNQPM